jgi:SHS2 domain-containing protein
LTAELYGDDSKNYPELDSVKAATYAEMSIKKTKEGYIVQAVLDV